MWGDFAPPDEIGIDFVEAIAPYMHSRARDIEASKQLSTYGSTLPCLRSLHCPCQLRNPDGDQWTAPRSRLG
jgi:hypothetical protein